MISTALGIAVASAVANNVLRKDTTPTKTAGSGAGTKTSGSGAGPLTVLEQAALAQCIKQGMSEKNCKEIIAGIKDPSKLNKWIEELISKGAGAACAAYISPEAAPLCEAAAEWAYAKITGGWGGASLFAPWVERGMCRALPGEGHLRAGECYIPLHRLDGTPNTSIANAWLHLEQGEMWGRDVAKKVSGAKGIGIVMQMRIFGSGQPRTPPRRIIDVPHSRVQTWGWSQYKTSTWAMNVPRCRTVSGRFAVVGGYHTEPREVKWPKRDPTHGTVTFIKTTETAWIGNSDGRLIGWYKD